jgi:manganese transport protein
MLTGETMTFFATSENLLIKILIVAAGVFFVGLLIYSILFPLIKKHRAAANILLHPTVPLLQSIDVPVYRKIAVALDFSDNDARLIAYAIGQARNESSFVLIHIVETATSILLGQETDDYETQQDQERLDNYVQQLKEKGYEAEGALGYRHRSKEIVRIVKATHADMLVVGAHGHTGFKDFVYGETINAVRHELKIPVLIVDL